MCSRGLVKKCFSSSGITFATSDLTAAFLSHMRGVYATSLRERAAWISKAFGSYSNDDLAAFMRSNLGKWGAEFHYESLFRGLDL